MTYRLRRMLLVNARTSGTMPSGLITEIDPRDGAAVIGDNSVGKTTTLELIPLFFGHLPSQIVGSGAGREPMLKYVLPAPESAIVFEYQRGESEEHDIRFAVLRRQVTNDAPEYRFFSGPFRKELFVQHSGTAGGLVFLDDAAMIDVARKANVEPGRRLSAADYRRVILGHRAATHDAVSLRQMSNSFSFGPVGKSLANLDRLVAAVVKKHVSFNDFVKVCVDMVSEELGSAGVSGGERNKLTMRQSRRQIQDWLVNRDACVDAIKLTPKVDDLQRSLSDFTAQEAVLRDLRGQIQGVLRAKRASGEQIRALAAAAVMARELSIKVEQVESARLAETLAQADSVAATAVDKANLEQRTLDHFSSENARKWETAVLEIPALRMRFDQVGAQLTLAVEKAGDIVSAYSVKIGEVRLGAATQAAEYERNKAPLRERCENERSAISARETERLEEFDREGVAVDAEIGSQIEIMEARRGALELQVQRPLASEKAAAELKAADGVLSTFLHEAAKVAEAGGKARLETQRLQHEFADDERRLGAARQALALAQAEAAAALASMTPAEGTLLSVLRASPSDAWKSNLARVLDERVLARTDLSVQDNSEGLLRQSDGLDPLAHAFGWHLDASPIPPPAWVDDESAQRRHTEAVAALPLAEDVLKKALEKVEKLSEAVAEAGRAQTAAEGQEAVFASRKASLVEKALLARERHDAEIQAGKTKATTDLGHLNKQLGDLRQDRKSRKGTQQLARQLINKEFDKQRDAATAQRDESIRKIDEIIAKSVVDQNVAIKGLEEQRDSQMGELGVDTVKVAALTKDFEALRNEIAGLEAKLSLVSQWKAWNAAVGPALVEKLAAAAAQAAVALAAARSAVTAHNSACTVAQREHQELVTTYSKQTDGLDTEIRQLVDLDDQLGDYGAAAVATPEDVLAAVMATELQASVRAQRQRLASIDAKISGLFQTLKSALTSRESSVADLVNLSLAEVEGQSPWRRAVQLRGAFQRIGPQVVTNVNTTLRTVLSSTAQFRTTILTFESEVRRFNRRLQGGMSAVSQFEWLSDVSLNMVTDFSQLGFMKKLEALDDVVRAHGSQVGLDPAKDLPTDDMAAALRDFMSVVGNDGSIEVNLGAHVQLSGSVTVKGVRKNFHREEELEQIDSNGLSNIILITLLSGMLNMIRGTEKIYVPWSSDEVGRYDEKNFASLMKMLRLNLIDVVTASPELTISKQRLFARRYKFADRGVIALYAKAAPAAVLPSAAPAEAIENPPLIGALPAREIQ